MAQNRDELNLEDRLAGEDQRELVEAMGNATLEDAAAGPEQVPEPEPEPEQVPEPTTRAGFLRYYHNITLDPDTAHIRLELSVDNRRVQLMGEDQPNRTPDGNRFINYFQVLSRESLEDRQYWEVELNGLEAVVAVAYSNISRTAPEGKFGKTGSWALRCSRRSYRFLHNREESALFPRIGVYLNRSAGTLSFYGVSGDTISLLHRVQTTFNNEPLHAGVGLVQNYALAELILL